MQTCVSACVRARVRACVCRGGGGVRACVYTRLDSNTHKPLNLMFSALDQSASIVVLFSLI